MEHKGKSLVDMKLDEILNTASVLETFRGWIEPQDYFSVENSRITLWPNDESQSRRYVGALMRVLKTKPTFEKNINSLVATFHYSGVEVKIYNYKTRKCAILKKTIVHEAEPEKIIPFKPSWVEEREELVCEMPQVETEVAAEAPQEVPF